MCELRAVVHGYAFFSQAHRAKHRVFTQSRGFDLHVVAEVRVAEPRGPWILNNLSICAFICFLSCPMWQTTVLSVCCAQTVLVKTMLVVFCVYVGMKIF